MVSLEADVTTEGEARYCAAENGPMTVAANVISIAEFRDRRASEARAEMLVLADSADRRIELATLLVRAGLASGRIDWADSLEAAERRLTDVTYRCHLLDLGVNATTATPLIDAVLALPGRDTILVCHADMAELDELRDRFPTAAVVTSADLTVDWLSGGWTGAGNRRVGGGAPGLEGMIEAAVALRASIAGIGRQMAVADSELDAGKALDGQIHLVAAMQRLSEVEVRLNALEGDLRAHLDVDQVSRS